MTMPKLMAVRSATEMAARPSNVPYDFDVFAADFGHDGRRAMLNNHASADTYPQGTAASLATRPVLQPHAPSMHPLATPFGDDSARPFGNTLGMMSGSPSFSPHQNFYHPPPIYHNGNFDRYMPPNFPPPLNGYGSTGVSPANTWLGGPSPSGMSAYGAPSPNAYHVHYHALVAHNLRTAGQTVKNLERMGFAADSTLPFDEQCDAASSYTAQAGIDRDIPSELIEGSFRYGKVDIEDVVPAQRFRVITLKNPTTVPMTVRRFVATMGGLTQRSRASFYIGDFGSSAALARAYFLAASLCTLPRAR